ncbi:hypothetical protein [Paracidovorax wautersii]|uniref:Uncharacterized protein n=1 Tax=Paracidovorax wautersii TaxID=1177982 RepID=A0ABU1IBL7_9BURK|nr:hypothetical protein [Paracidovorax wautersii]MDR6214572.1 hypothetical protein [Paracidovorax wautersii]
MHTPASPPAPTAAPHGWRRWAVPIAVVALVGSLLVAFRAWTDYQLQAPVATDYARFLDALTEQSPQAAAYRAAYGHHFARDTVAARHFEQVCATMLRMAESDGATVPPEDAAMAGGCRRLTARYAADALPRD